MFKFEIIGNEIINKEDSKMRNIDDKEKIIKDFLKQFNNRYSIKKDNNLYLNFYEAFYLLEKEEIELYYKDKIISFKKTLKYFTKRNPKFLTNYPIYKDLISKGYLIRTGYKYGAQFRVYDKGVKLGEDHSKWIVYPVTEKESFSWYDFSAKNRVAHSTKKRLVVAVLDDEKDITYYEIKWIRI